MKNWIVAGALLGLPCVASAELWPGTSSYVAEYKITDASTGADLGRVYVPGAGMAGHGKDLWYWTGTPWGGDFELSYEGDFKTYTPPSGATYEESIAGAFDAANLPTSGTIAYDWKVTDDHGNVAYVDRDGTKLDWYTADTMSYLATGGTITFTATTGTINVSALQAAVGDTL
jgi:hypothetical protein